MKKTLEEIRKYDTFIFDKFDILYLENSIKIEFYYEIKDLKKFVHTLVIPYTNNNIDKEYVKKLVFNIGMLELVSYYKATLAKNIVVNCGFLDDYQKEFFKKVYYNGLGEFLYVNGIEIPYDEFVNIYTNGDTYDSISNNKFNGNLIAIGGGKDSCVTLSLMDKDNSKCFIINPKDVMLECAYAAGYSDEDIVKVYRTIDKELINLNNEGYLNGHTPFSAMVAFVSYLSAYLNEVGNIVLSNESSANEANVSGTNINHQYSKSYEFEHDFQKYEKEYLNGNIKYYSLLRPLTEYQIGMIFSKCQKYHHIFKSCNVGSKENPWVWCSHCAKCLFVYSLLSPHMYKEELVDIFGKDLFEDESLLTTFKELLGYENVKPFDCVGTFEEINYAITKTIKKLGNQELPTLLKYYKDNYYNEDILNKDLEHYYNDLNSLSNTDQELIKGAINYDR